MRSTGVKFVVLISSLIIFLSSSLLQPAVYAASSECSKAWYNESMTAVSIGHVTASKSKAAVLLDDRLFDTGNTLSSGTVLNVYEEVHIADKTYYRTDNNMYIAASPNVKFTKTPASAIACMETAISNKNINRMVTEAQKLDTPLSKVVYLHDALIDSITYDYELYNGTGGRYESYRALGAFAYRMAVCEGYSEALSALLSKVGIENKLVRSTAMDHTWNLVKLGGNWYHVDATWDDGNERRYKHFLLSDKKLTELDHYGWSSTTKAASEKYNYFSDLKPFHTDIHNDQIYYANKNVIFRLNIETGESYIMATMSAKSSFDQVKFTQYVNGDIYYYDRLNIGRITIRQTDDPKVPEDMREELKSRGISHAIMNDQLADTRDALDFHVINDKIYYAEYGGWYNNQPYLAVYQCDLDGNLVLLNRIEERLDTFGEFRLIGDNKLTYYYNGTMYTINLTNS